jgi:hypothetical protein
MFTLDHDTSNEMLTVTTQGFWTLEEVDTFAAKLKLGVSEFTVCNRPLKLLIDSRDASIQTASVVAKLEQLSNDLLSHSSDRIAIVVGSTLKRLQVSRSLPIEQAQVFTNVSAARSWLLPNQT